VTDRDDSAYGQAMTRELRRPSRWALAASGIAGALLTGTLVTLGIGGAGSVPGAAAAAPEATAPTPVVQDESASVTFLGDSWTDGVGATAMRGYAVRTGQQLRWEYEVLGVSGSGYSLPGTNDLGGTFDERVDRAVATHADVIVVQGSLNERNSTPAALAPAAAATLSRLRLTADPDTRILVLGAPYNPGTPGATIDWINAAIEDAAARAGVEFVDVAAENWTDPADPSIWDDALHPNDAGHQLIADRLEPLLLDALDR
jgi:lysophospholipase L1-like esterase